MDYPIRFAVATRKYKIHADYIGTPIIAFTLPDYYYLLRRLLQRLLLLLGILSALWHLKRNDLTYFRIFPLQMAFLFSSFTSCLLDEYHVCILH